MNELTDKHIDSDVGNNSSWLLLVLLASALLLAGRLVYLYLADAERFPITTIKVAASYQHVSHKEIEDILAQSLNASFFFLPVNQLQKQLSAINWIEEASVERVWPDTLKIKMIEKKPVAVWKKSLITADGKVFSQGAVNTDTNLPKLSGPEAQALLVLQVYEKLGKILSNYGMKATGLNLRENQSWVLTFGNDQKIYLGKKDLEARLLRFCKAYPAVFAEKSDQLASVDLRYPRGMAVQWKQQTGR